MIIAGGGLAGLSCAYELKKRGLQVVVLEGQGRVGGRVQTLREGLYPGLTAEAGATRIPDTHELTLSYVREFGLQLEVLTGGDLAEVVRVRGHNYVVGKGSEPDWPFKLSLEERRLGRSGLLKQYLAGPLAQLIGSEDARQIPEPILALDHFTIQEYLAKQGLSSEAIELMMPSTNTSVSYALLLTVMLNGQASKNYFHIRGGNDQLPAALAEKLGGTVRFGCRILSIGQDDRSTWAVIERGGECETVRGDYVVSALPFSVSRNLFVEARLSPEKQHVVRNLNYAPVHKVSLQMREQFWRSRGQSGSAQADDLMSDRFSALGLGSAKERGLIRSEVFRDAVKLDEMDEEARVQTTLAEAEVLFPGSREHFEAARSKSWRLDPWQQGALPLFGPGQLSFIAAGARREGRVLFAGEHTSRWHGWMQGAFESAQRVVGEIWDDMDQDFASAGLR